MALIFLETATFFMRGSFLFLGTGGSAGVPVIGCSCRVCTSFSSFNQRLRTSGLIKIQGKVFLIDAGPDFRSQALKFGISHLDGVVLTHTHYDHIGGIDDLRVYYFLQKRRLPCLVSKETYEEIAYRYHYLLRPFKEGESVTAQLDFHVLEKDFGRELFEGVPFHYLSYNQVGMKVTGLRLHNFAYVSDIKEYSKETLDALQGVETLVLSALRKVPSRMHFSVDEAIAFSRKINAKKTWLTHIAHDLEYDELSAELPEDIRLSYDGLEIEI